MTRGLARILLFLILGGITTSAVAWGCTLLDVVATSSGEMPARLRAVAPPVPDSEVRAGARAGYRRTRITWTGQRYAESGRLEYWLDGAWRSALDHAGRQSRRHRIDIIEAGFPFIALRGAEIMSEPYTLRGKRTLRASWLLRLPSPGHDPRPILLLRPILPGFVIDTILYAFAWLGLARGTDAVRRGWRRRRGCCPRCAYRLHAQLESGCPECGWNRER